ncbi:unnamed protein product [Cylicocyclus nassatus]|uniref:Receptor expression-enhancing protein n=1 Tax=Cylicocyclus nassatus TaxID=53992 RepID=A0AA36DI63_CYLNA|nr:unnamed protein product [Cylicocyclus nassatus]
MFSLLCHLASAFVGALIPVFYSYKTIKKPTQKMLSYWSKYWAVFGSFLAVDAVLDSIFISYFIPFYEFGKLLFLLWAVNPYTAGAQFVFDKVLAPFIKRHEKKMDVYVDTMVDNVMTHGPELAVAAGVTVWNIARNLHALSRIRADRLGRAIMQSEQTVAIEEVLTDDEVQKRPPQAAAPPPEQKPVEVKAEQQDSDDEVIFINPHQHEEGRTSKSSMSSKTPMPTKRRRGRRPTSNVTARRQKMNKGAKRGNHDDDEFVLERNEDEPVAINVPIRRSNRVAKTIPKKQLIIVGDGVCDEE